MRDIALPCGRQRNSTSTRSSASARTNFSVVRRRRLGCVKWTNCPSSRSLVTCRTSNVRMAEQQPQQFAAGIAGAPTMERSDDSG